MVNFYVLGDSLTDNGNLARDFPTELSVLLAAQAAQGYVGGRALNGPTWAEYLPLITGLESDTEDNYAYGGATSGVGGLVEAMVPLGGATTGFLTQLGQFQAMYPSWTPMMWWVSGSVLTTCIRRLNLASRPP